MRILLLLLISSFAFGQRISDLPAANALTGTEVVAGVQSSVTKKISINQIVTFVGTGFALTADPLSQFSSTTSSQLAGIISNETGTGSLVFDTSPTFGTLITTPLIKITTGSPGAGKFLTSDADGDATWSTVAISFIDGETPSGTIDDANLTFTIANTPITGSVKVFLNGLRLKLTTDYTISGVTITMIVAPTTGDILLADYIK